MGSSLRMAWAAAGKARIECAEAAKEGGRGHRLPPAPHRTVPHLNAARKASRSARCLALTSWLCLRVMVALLRKSVLPCLQYTCSTKAVHRRGTAAGGEKKGAARAARDAGAAPCLKEACGAAKASPGSKRQQARHPRQNPPPPPLQQQLPSHGQLHDALALPHQQLGVVVHRAALRIVRQRVAEHEPAGHIGTCLLPCGEAAKGRWVIHDEQDWRTHWALPAEARKQSEAARLDASSML